LEIDKWVGVVEKGGEKQQGSGAMPCHSIDLPMLYGDFAQI